MKTKTLDRNYSNSSTNNQLTRRYENFKDSVDQKLDKSTVQITFLYVLSILSISCWIISLKILPFGDMFQFLLGAAVLSVNLLVFKYTKM